MKRWGGAGVGIETGKLRDRKSLKDAERERGGGKVKWKSWKEVSLPQNFFFFFASSVDINLIPSLLPTVRD